MTESTIIHTKGDGVIKFAALGGGAIDSAGALIGAALDFDVAYEAGDMSVTYPVRAINTFLDRGRMTSPPSIRYGDDGTGTFSFTAYLRDLTDATTETLSDLLATCAGFARGNVGTNWESTLASAAGAGDAAEFTVAVMLTMTNEGDASDISRFICNYVQLTGGFSEGDPSVLNLSGTIYDRLDATGSTTMYLV